MNRRNKGLPYVPGLIGYGIIYALGSVAVALGLHHRKKRM